MKYDFKEYLRYLISVVLLFMFIFSIISNSFTKIDSFLILFFLVGIQWLFSKEGGR